MAKKKNDLLVDETDETKKKVNVAEYLKDLRKKTESTTFNHSKYGEISHYVNTGDYALNMNLCGNPTGGVPAGRIVMFNGESQTGKTYIIANIIKNALVEQEYDHIWYLDSEGGSLAKGMTKLGIDISRVEHVLIDSAEDLTVKTLSILTTIKEMKDKDSSLRFMLCLDSIGAIVSNKVYTDAENKGEQKADQGGRAKTINTFIKAVTIPCLRTDTAFLIANHVYEDPASYCKSKIKNAGGGKGLGYEATIVVQISKGLEANDEKPKKDKDKEKPKTKEEKDAAKANKVAEETTSDYGSTLLKFFTVKNRLIKSFYTTHMLLDFSKGPLKYYGLKPFAQKFGLITKVSDKSYNVKGFDGEQFSPKQLVLEKKIWDKIMPDMIEAADKEFAYASADSNAEETLNESDEEAVDALTDQEV